MIAGSDRVQATRSRDVTLFGLAFRADNRLHHHGRRLDSGAVGAGSAISSKHAPEAIIESSSRAGPRCTGGLAAEGRTHRPAIDLDAAAAVRAIDSLRKPAFP